MVNSGTIPKRKRLVYNHYDNEATNHYRYDASTSPRAMTRQNSGHSRYPPCTTERCRLYTCLLWNPLQKQLATRTRMVSVKNEAQQTPLTNALLSSTGHTEPSTS